MTPRSPQIFVGQGNQEHKGYEPSVQEDGGAGLHDEILSLFVVSDGGKAKTKGMYLTYSNQA